MLDEKEYKKKYYREHCEETKERMRMYYKRHCKRILERLRKNRRDYPEKTRETNKRWRENHREQIKERRKEYDIRYRKKHLEEVRRSGRRWRKNYPEKNRRIQREYKRKKLHTDIRFRLDNGMRRNIWDALKQNKAGRHWEDLVGYTLKDLMVRLEYQFNDKMSWENYGYYWWIDHRKPRSLFCYTKPEEQAFKDCWCLANLQPLEKVANIKKSNHYPIT